MTREIDDETLMAYADGELEPDAAARVERAMASDQGLAARVDLFRRTREAVAADARRHPAPAPPALVAAVRELAARETPAASAPNVRPQDLRAAAARPWRRWQLPAAASIALAVGLGAGLLADRDPVEAPGLQISALADPSLESALATVPSGERTELPNGKEIAVIASFRGRDGELCREFEYDQIGATTVVAVACREDDGWNVRFAVVAAPIPESGYAPASSLETLDAYLSSIEAGQPLSLEEEAAALADL